MCSQTIVQAYALLAERDFNVDRHIIIQSLCFTGGPKHFACRRVDWLLGCDVRVRRIQVGPRLNELTEGVMPQHRYYFYDGLKYNARLVDLKATTWIEMSKQWLCTSMGDPGPQVCISRVAE